MWERVYSLRSDPVLLTRKVCLKEKSAPEPSFSAVGYILRLEARGVVEDQFSLGENGGSMKGIIYVDEPSTLLGDGLQWVGVGKVRRDIFSRRLKQCASSAPNFGRLAFRFEEQGSSTSNERSSHGCSRKDGKPVLGYGRQDSSTRCSNSGFKVEVVAWAVAIISSVRIERNGLRIVGRYLEKADIRPPRG